MKFSGHETFAIREGWLHKGLKLLIEDPDQMFDKYVADRLGVGKNMSRSIRHWLEVTGLAVRMRSALDATDLARLIYERDPYFVEIGTWWALHVNLVHPENRAFTWQWFFNEFNQARFKRAVCIDKLSRYLQQYRPPRPRTLERDVACLLQSYARSIPTTCDDPEDALECPFVELGLLSHFHASGDYQVHRGEKAIPPHLLGYALASALEEAREGRDTVDISAREATTIPGGPGKAFVLTVDALLALALNAEETDPNAGIRVVDLAGDRRIRIPKMQPIAWLKNHYRAIQRRNRHAA